MPCAPGEEWWMTAAEAAQVLGLSVQTFRRRARDLGVVRRDWGRRRYHRQAIERAATLQAIGANAEEVAPPTTNH